MVADRAKDHGGLLGPLEGELMEILWSTKRPMTVREVLELANGRRTEPLAYTTVMTVMSRLAEKGALARRREGRSFAYEPTAADAAAIAVRQVVRDFGDTAVAHFVEEARADPELRRRLKRLLDER